MNILPVLYIIIMYTINAYVLFRIYIGARYQHISLELIMHYTHTYIYYTCINLHVGLWVYYYISV